jgi:hypothetical protein
MTGHTASLVPDDQVLGTKRHVARSPKASSSSGTGACRASTGLDESAMTTKRPRPRRESRPHDARESEPEIRVTDETSEPNGYIESGEALERVKGEAYFAPEW